MTDKRVYLTPTDVAKRLGVTRDAVYKLMKSHPLEPDALRGNTSPLWLPKTIDNWRAEHPKRRGPRKKTGDV